MPKTKFQNFIFTLMTAILMAYCMIVYNVAINSETGLVNQTFLIALKEFPVEAIIVFLLAYFVASPIAKKQAFRIVNPKEDNKIFIILPIQTFTVLTMVGLMSIYALFAQHLINSNVICNYITVNESMFFDNLSDIKNYCSDIVCFYSNNDPYVKYEKEKEFADTITENQIMIFKGGHLNSESGYTKFPDLLKLI